MKEYIKPEVEIIVINDVEEILLGSIWKPEGEDIDLPFTL